MSRRPGDRAAQNQQTIKSLLKLDANKSCADCKRNKHPRWASWNLGIFVCIRCSGIHRGMGTHISRVKSVDLDAWTDEQLQSVLKWGNARANKYWEAKLAPGHVPSEGKIENFIRTKYESKRWVMDGPMPDPSTLEVDGGDDDVPLNVVREKAQLDRASSQRAVSSSSQPAPVPKPQLASFDLIGGDEAATPRARPSTTDPPAAARLPPTKAQQPSQLLGGLDFLGAPPERPLSASSKPAGMSRPDLKQSILSLYSSTPKPQAQPAPQQHERQPSFGVSQPAKTSAFGDLNDAFSGLNFGSTSSVPPAQNQQPAPPKPSGGFPSFNPPPPVNKSQPAPPVMSSPPQIIAPPPLAGGGFFDAGPKPPPKPAAPKSAAPPPLAVRKVSNASDGFGDFSSAFNPSAPNTAPMTASSIAYSSNGLLDLSNPPSAINSARPTDPNQQSHSIFNLSAPKPPGNYNAVLQTSAPAAKTTFQNTSNNSWASNDWNSSSPAVATPQTGLSVASPSLKSATGADFGWGSATSPAMTSNNASTNPASEWATPVNKQSDWSKPAAAPSKTTPAAPPPRAAQTGWGASDAGLGLGSGGWGDPTPPASSTLGGFGASSIGGAAPAPPKIAPEEDFGDWGSAPPVSSPGGAAAGGRSGAGNSSGGGFGGMQAPPPSKPMNSEDLWGNVWE